MRDPEEQNQAMRSMHINVACRAIATWLAIGCGVALVAEVAYNLIHGRSILALNLFPIYVGSIALVARRSTGREIQRLEMSLNGKRA
jgi:hypothetical protein